MRVYLATQVLSPSVAAGITTLCMTGDKLDGEAIHTANFLEMFDKFGKKGFACIIQVTVPANQQVESRLS